MIQIQVCLLCLQTPIFPLERTVNGLNTDATRSAQGQAQELASRGGHGGGWEASNMPWHPHWQLVAFSQGTWLSDLAVGDCGALSTEEGS